MRVLLVTAHYPDDTKYGAGQRTRHLHQALCERADVTTLVMKEHDGAPALKTVNARGVLAEISYPWQSLAQKYRPVPAIAPLVREVVDLDAYDAVVSRYLGPLGALPPFRGRAIADADDAYYRYPSASTPWSRGLATLKSVARRQIGARALQQVDHAWFCCQRDQSHFRLRSSSVLPNIVVSATPAPVSTAGTAPVVLMVGALWYRPNQEAVEAFLAESWPAVRAAQPEARFRLVGAVTEPLKQRWSQVPGVEVAGFVDDLGAEYRQARATVVPVRYGGGTQIKALESLAHGRVPVVSSFVASGFAPLLRDGESFWVADTADAVTRRLCALLDDPTQGEPLAHHGQSVVATHFSEPQFRQQVHDTLDRLRVA